MTSQEQFEKISLKSSLQAFLTNPQNPQNNPEVKLRVISNSPLQICDEFLDFVELKRIQQDFGRKTGFNDSRQFCVVFYNWEWVFERGVNGVYDFDIIVHDYE